MVWVIVASPVVLYLGYFYTVDRLSRGRMSVWLAFLIVVALVFTLEMTIQRIWPNGERRHRVLGTFTMIIYCILFVTGSVTYVMLYIL